MDVPANRKDCGVDMLVLFLLLVVPGPILVLHYVLNLGWQQYWKQLGLLYSPTSPLIWFLCERYQHYVFDCLMSSWGIGWYCSSFASRSSQWSSRHMHFSIRPFPTIIDSPIICFHIYWNQVTPVWMNSISFTVIHHRSFLTISPYYL